jgi:hypothetical protein
VEPVETVADPGDVVVLEDSGCRSPVSSADGVEPVEQLGLDPVVEALASRRAFHNAAAN